jgi:hypothetical protein
MDFRPSNGVLYGASSSLQTINVKTGHATTIAPLADLMVSIAFSPSDQLYAVNNAGTTLFTLNPVTGSTLTSVPITGTSSANEINGIDFAANGTLYGVGAALYSLNPLTGVASRITPSGTNITGPGASPIFDDIDFAPDGVLRGVTFDQSQVNSLLFTINTSTGLGTLVGGTGFGMDGLASIPTPEPSSLVLLSFGILCAMMSCWRCRSRRSQLAHRVYKTHSTGPRT